MLRKDDAIIVDVDGTLADVRQYRHHVLSRPRDFDAFHRAGLEAPPLREVIAVVQSLSRLGFKILIVSGREEKWLEPTIDWLARNDVPVDKIIFRKSRDFRQDSFVKKDIFIELAEEFNIRLAIDDNPQIIDLWVELGLPTVAVPGWELEPPKK